MFIKSSDLLLKYVVKSVLISCISLFFIICISSIISQKFNINEYEYFAYISVFICSFITSFFSTNMLKNNILPFSILSNFILLIITIICTIINDNIIILLINFGLIFIGSMIGAIVNIRRKQ